MVKMALKPPLCCQLSMKSCDRLSTWENEHIHASDAVFLHKIPKEDVKLQVSLQELFDRDLEHILPELFERDTY